LDSLLVHSMARPPRPPRHTQGMALYAHYLLNGLIMWSIKCCHKILSCCRVVQTLASNMGY